ncbi:TldD/PmbA family protein [Candidatus Eisenbacteria bacterium]|uniref:TldD/PmbA family protein n=1 Tax=Eiseniibacteriota bacterium TaxID=2212470 RepID=A0ABV6YJM3_UNCEI
MDKQDVKALCDRILAFSGADEAEVIYHEVASALTRFAKNQIEQNVAEVVADVSFRGIWGKKIARVTTSKFDDDSLRRLVQTAEEVAKVQRDMPDLLPLPDTQEYQTVDHFCETTAGYSPEARAKMVADHIVPVKAKGLTAAGMFKTGFQAIAVVNSKGLSAYDRFSEASFSTQTMGDKGAGVAAKSTPRVAEVDIQALTATAIEKCVASEDPQPLEPGEYTVILEPSAASNLLMFTGGLGFSGLAHIEGRTPFVGKIGEKIFGENITIEDNAYHEITGGVPFDFEGLPRQRVVLVENGVLKTVLHDRQTAQKMDTETTGHSLPQPNASGPWPFNLLLHPGDQSPEEILKSTKRGILVTQFHYTNIVNPMELSLTGMTRNGTFMIEDGKITHAVKNMRFTESVIKAFSNVTAIGNDLTLATSMFGGGYLVPTLRVENFTFSSATDF